MAYVVAGTSNQLLGFRLAKQLGEPFLPVVIDSFPDGEKHIRFLADVEKQHVFLLQSVCQKPDEYLMEFFLMADALKDLGASKITAVIPYFAYARQDTRFEKGEAVSSKTVAKLIENIGIDDLITIDCHLHHLDTLQKIFKIPTRNLTAMPILAQYAKANYDLKNPLVIGPDEEAEQWAKVAASSLGTDYAVLQKERKDAYEVKISNPETQVAGKDVLIVDDIISTGGTIAQTTSVLKKHGAKKIIVAATHPILTQDAIEKMFLAGIHNVYGTDTVPSPISYVSVAGVLAEAISYHPPVV